MTQDSHIDHLETAVQGMQWETISLEPAQEDVQALDQELPDAWRELLEQPEFTQEEMQAFIDAPLDVPEGDITENARQALVEFDIDINEVMQELDAREMDGPEMERGNDHHDEFGR